MDTIKRLAVTAMQVVRSRLFAASLLAIISSGMIAYVSVNTRAVTVIDGDVSKVVLTMHNDPHAVLAEAGVTLQDEDELEVSLVRSEIEISRAFEVPVTADGITTLVSTAGGTVEDVLNRIDVKVGKYDTINIAKDQMVTPDTSIVIERVAYREFTKTKSVPYNTTIRYTNTIRKGKTKISQSGKDGERTLIYREQIVDGKVVDTVLVSDKVTTKPTNRVKLVGTTTGIPLSNAPFDIELDDKGHPVKFKKVFRGKATAYSSQEDGVGTHTSTGLRAKVGVVAVNPKLIPYGTKLYIVSPDGSYVYGYAIAGDTGGAARSGRIVADLYMDTVKECYDFGRRDMIVYVL